MYISLRRARLALFHLHTKGTAVSLSEQNWDTVVSHTEGYSGSDIANVTNDALMEPVRELEKTLYWKPVSGKLRHFVSAHTQHTMMAITTKCITKQLCFLRH